MHRWLLGPKRGTGTLKTDGCSLHPNSPEKQTAVWLQHTSVMGPQTSAGLIVHNLHVLTRHSLHIDRGLYEKSVAGILYFINCTAFDLAKHVHKLMLFRCVV